MHVQISPHLLTLPFLSKKSSPEAVRGGASVSCPLNPNRSQNIDPGTLVSVPTVVVYTWPPTLSDTIALGSVCGGRVLVARGRWAVVFA